MKRYYERFFNGLNYAQSLTNDPSYMLIGGLMWGGIFTILIVIGAYDYGVVKGGIEKFSEYEYSLRYMKLYNLGNLYLQDENILLHMNKTYVDIYYKNLTSLLMNLDMYDVKNDALDRLIKQNVNINIFIALLPFVLNLSWATNIFIIVGTIFNRIVIGESSWICTYWSLLINFIVGGCLFCVHFLNYIFPCQSDKKNK